jgi:hypothetical protein
MAPKHGLSTEEIVAKRVKNSPSLVSRSATPAEITARVPFAVEHPPLDTKRKPSKKKPELVGHAELHISPFEAKGALRKGELNQYYTVTPGEEWEAMKKYDNFIGEWKRLLCAIVLIMVCSPG